jgi:DNA-directed RNA polymerase subunit RPC12/RpoP
MGNNNYFYRCIGCGRELDAPYSACPFCGGPVIIEYPEPRFRVDKSKPGIWRYGSLLPGFGETVSHGEGLTPISSVDGVLVKNEKKNPTGTYADRASAVIASYARSTGVRLIKTEYIEAFTQSLLYYLKGIAKVRVLVRSLDSLSMDDIVRIYGMNNVDVTTKDTSIGDEARINYLNPLTIEGLKTIVFELYERGVRAENIVVPVETGVLAYSLVKGLDDLRRAGAEPGYTVVAAVVKGASVPEIVKRHGVKVAEIEAEEVLDALGRLTKKGFVTMPISAVSFAVARILGSSVAVLTMGYKPYRLYTGRGQLREEIIELLRKKGRMTAYEMWKERQSYTLRAFYKVLRGMEARGEVCSEVEVRGARKVKYFKLCGGLNS